jgi:hypothetical protein
MAVATSNGRPKAPAVRRSRGDLGGTARIRTGEYLGSVRGICWMDRNNTPALRGFLKDVVSAMR